MLPQKGSGLDSEAVSEAIRWQPGRVIGIGPLVELGPSGQTSGEAGELPAAEVIAVVPTRIVTAFELWERCRARRWITPKALALPRRTLRVNLPRELTPVLTATRQP